MLIIGKLGIQSWFVLLLSLHTLPFYETVLLDTPSSCLPVASVLASSAIEMLAS